MNYAHSKRNIWKGLRKTTKYSKKMPPIKSCMFSQKAMHTKCFLALRSQPVRFFCLALLSIVVNCRLPFLVEILQLFVLCIKNLSLKLCRERDGIFFRPMQGMITFYEWKFLIPIKCPWLTKLHMINVQLYVLERKRPKIVHLDYQMATFREMSMKFN